MIEIKDVVGSKEASQPLIVNVDTVYIHSNVRPYVDPEHPEMKDMFIYDEIQYELYEYIQIMADNDKTRETEVTDLQMAMANFYETATIGGGQ